MNKTMSRITKTFVSMSMSCNHSALSIFQTVIGAGNTLYEFIMVTK
jgi:hypothetical protein